MWQVDSSCYFTKAAAVQAHAAKLNGAILGDRLATVADVTESSIQLDVYNPATEMTTGVLMSIDPVPCQQMTMIDVMPVLLAIFAGWVSIYVVKLLWKANHDA